MKTTLRHLFIVLAMASLACGAARASQGNVQILNDSQMASIKGGWCPFEECEAGPGTGVCQPYPASRAGLCAVARCSYSNSTAGNVDVLGCTLAGKVTCTANRTYRQCILAFKFSACSNGANPYGCGFLVVPTCTIDRIDRTCVCGIASPGNPCDWTDCAP